MVEGRLKDLLRSHRDIDDFAALGAGMGPVVGWHAHALEETRARIAGGWRDFASTPPCWDVGGGGSKR